jgi:hypothetical protein
MSLSYQMKIVIKFNKSKEKSLQVYGTAWNHRILHNVVQCLYQHNLKILRPPYSKHPPKKIMIHIKPTVMPMTLNYIKRCLYKCNISQVVSMKQNVNFKIQLP